MVDLLLDHRPPVVVIDLGSVTFLDSTGIAVLVAAAQTGVVLAVVATAHAVLRALEMTGVDALLPLYATVDEAVDGAALTPPPAPQSPTPPEPT